MLVLPAELTLEQTTATLSSLSGLLAEELTKLPAGEAVSINAAPVTQIDTAALALLLDLQRQCQAAGRSLQVDQAPSRLRDLAALYGVAELLGLH